MPGLSAMLVVGALALAGAGGAARGQDGRPTTGGPAGEDSVSPAVARERGPGAGTAGGAGPASPTATAEAEERSGFLGALQAGVDWFFKRGEGEAAHERTWGVVPLVVADSNAGFGGGLKFVEKDLFGTEVRLDTSATYTSNEFFNADVELDGPTLGGWFDWEAFARYRNRPRLRFWGIGNSADDDDEASLALEETLVEMRLGSEIGTRYAVFTVWRFANVNSGDGEHGNIDPVSEVFADDLPAGFADNDAYTNAVGLLAVFDMRDDRYDPKLGFRTEVGGLYHGPEIGDSPYRFGYYWVDVAIYLPLAEKWPVLALHGRLESVDASRQRVPFYALPQLGGTRSLRGFLEGRIRDRHAVLFQAELRFPIWKVLSGAVFVDTGRVFEDITEPPFFDNYYYDAGVGVRFVLHPDIVVRLDFAVSREEITFALAFGHAF